MGVTTRRGSGSIVAGAGSVKGATADAATVEIGASMTEGATGATGPVEAIDLSTGCGECVAALSTGRDGSNGFACDGRGGRAITGEMLVSFAATKATRAVMLLLHRARPLSCGISVVIDFVARCELTFSCREGCRGEGRGERGCSGRDGCGVQRET